MGKNKDIREAVEAELSYDPLVDAKDITVKNINGDVALDGTVANYPQYLEAGEAAWRVAGVTNVHNHLEVVLLPGDVRDDAMLTTAVNDALAANVTVPEGIEATARNGNLTLTGTVDYGSQRAAAEKAVRELTGLRNVKDEIEVAFAVDPADVSELVTQALRRSALVPDDSDVVVSTSESRVTLTGHVRTRTERNAVVGAAWMGYGVMDVVDELEVTG
jgi:osmotically-inducible protein OsmY